MKNLITVSLAVLVCAASSVGTINFTGRWRTNWGTINLIQTGAQVNGTYSGNYTGSIKGVVTGSRLNFTWMQPEGLWGRGYFDFISREKAFELHGKWGAGISDTNGGEWVGVKDKEGYN